MIKEQQTQLEEGKLDGKNQDHLLKSKVNPKIKEHGGHDYQPKCIDQSIKGKITKLSSTKKDRKKNNCRYCAKVGHVEKNC